MCEIRKRNTWMRLREAMTRMCVVGQENDEECAAKGLNRYNMQI